MITEIRSPLVDANKPAYRATAVFCIDGADTWGKPLYSPKNYISCLLSRIAGGKLTKDQLIDARNLGFNIEDEKGRPIC